MEIKSLENIDFETLFQGFENAFSDYEIQFKKEEIRSMLKRRGYCPKFSFGALDNDKLVSFTLNGIGSFKNIPTAYDTGTGTIKEYRGMGIAGKIFSYSIPFLKEIGIRQYVLEVLTNNHKAINIYRQMNFEETRLFNCFRQDISKINIKRNNRYCRVSPIDIRTIKNAQSWCDFIPSWQNSIDSIERGESDLFCLGAFVDGILAGFCVIDKKTGDVAQIAVAVKYRRKGIATALLHQAINYLETKFVKVLNISADYQPMQAFLESMNIELVSNQFEMSLPV